ncbi:MAG: dipeptidase [Thermoguttaceae bacterium]|jgi:acetylornithine deacetylase/succinyl-diaminopimelate desuccinylase-like protein
MDKVQQYIDKNKEVFLNQWFEVLRIPSVSVQKEHKDDMIKTADWAVSLLKDKLGMEARTIPTEGNPLVYGESPAIPGAPTVMLYGHYDVMPSEPNEEWRTPPFEPTIVDDKVYCRGANDDKGQWCAQLCGMQTYLALHGSFPLQVKVILEGEEEDGSRSLASFLESEENRKMLACDALLVSDTSAAGEDLPAITYGLRGIVGFEIKLTGPNRDLHSGIYGGSVYNPAIVLSKLISSMIDDSGKVQIPGFYDDVVALTQLERDALAKNPFDPEAEKKNIGIGATFGEREYTVLERRGARPSFDVNGLTSGYQGEGGKTIIPSWASAKITFRTVPNMDPEKIRAGVETFVREQVPDDLKVDINFQQGSGGMVTELTGKFIVAASEVLEKVYGVKPVFLRDGGSIPIVSKLRDALNAETVLVGFGLEDDGIHSPNEKFNLKSFFRGVKTGALLWEAFGKISK